MSKSPSTIPRPTPNPGDGAGRLASLAAPENFEKAALATNYVRTSGVGLKALDLGSCSPARAPGPRRSSRSRATEFPATAAPVDLETSSSSSIRTSSRRATTCGSSSTSWQAPAAAPSVANRGRAPGQVFGEKLELGQHVEPLHVAAADGRAHRHPRSAEDAGVLPPALLERRRLHVLHGGRLQGGRRPAARRTCAVCRRPAVRTGEVR